MTTSNVYAKLGDVSFVTGVSDYQQIARTHTNRWVQQNRLGRTPAMQYVGADAETVSITGTVIPEYAGKHDLLKDLRALADTGTAQPLYVHWRTGEYVGLWCITSVQETQSGQRFKDGLPATVSYSIALTAYGEDT